MPLKPVSFFCSGEPKVDSAGIQEEETDEHCRI